MPLIPIDVNLQENSVAASLSGQAIHSAKEINNRLKAALFYIGLGLLLLPGLLHAYLLMPFPGSQNLNAITLCYYLEKAVLPLRIAGATLIALYIFKYFTSTPLRNKLVKAGLLMLCFSVYYFTDVQYRAEAMFEEPRTIKFADALRNKVPESYIILGVVNHGVAKAYPLVYLGYHHKIQDNVGSLPVLVTYCTMCRSGRVFSPIINGRRETFRLVGARHYNAVIEDESTRSWWYQATGAAAAGPLKGSSLKELHYEQSSLSSWLKKYPSSLILQPDRHYLNDYADLKNYDRVQPVDKDKSLENKDALTRKSWVVGVLANNQAKAYNWRKLIRTRLVNDLLARTPVLIGMESDSATFHAWNRIVDGRELHFTLNNTGQLTDHETASIWDWNGLCCAGASKGKKLLPLQAYQEYWHSWKHFHEGTQYL